MTDLEAIRQRDARCVMHEPPKHVYTDRRALLALCDEQTRVIQKYASHDRECIFYHPNSIASDCNCGFKAALADVRGSKP